MKIEILEDWGDGFTNTTESKRDYRPYVITGHPLDGGPGGTVLNLFQDAENGVVVADVEKYEAWQDEIDDLRRRVNALDGDSL